MADATVLDSWLDQWEELNKAGQGISPSEFAARYCGDAAPDLVKQFISQAEKLISVGKHLPGIEITTSVGSPNTPVEKGTPPTLSPAFEAVPGYRLVKRLGSGGFGTVWEATSPGGFSVALKFLDLRGPAGQLEQRALKLVKKLRHAHVLSVFAAYEVGPWLVIACELADQSLADRLAECRQQGLEGVPVAELLRYMREAAEGLDYLNGMAIQHRDVKPLNLLLVGGSLKVADLGLLKQLAAAEASHTGCKTYAYAPPEFFDDKTLSQSDQYSLAASYCELRGGSLPFTGSQAQLMWGHLQQEPDLSMLPEAERPIVLRALSKKAGERWPSCTAFAEQLAIAVRDHLADAVVSPEESNRQRWLASGEPRLWLHERKARWSEKELQSLLARLERSDYWPLDADAVVELLGELKKTWRKPGTRVDGPRTLRFVWVPPGSFLMGSPEGEEGRGDDEAQHRVTITRGFWLGAFPVTQKQYRKLVGNNPSRFKGDDHPVETVTWESATEFCRQLSVREKRDFRLPTEAEWEYACRAGSKNAYYFGSKSHRVGQLGSLADKVLGGLVGGKDYLAAYAWYESNAGGRTRAVGQKKPNAWGLYDMHGNVWEWCFDWYDKAYYAESPEVDPSGPPSGAWKVLRGGSWANEARRCRSAQRSWLPPQHPQRYGFRVLMEADDAWGRNE